MASRVSESAQICHTEPLLLSLPVGAHIQHREALGLPRIPWLPARCLSGVRKRRPWRLDYPRIR